jgi:hypothetical protein
MARHDFVIKDLAISIRPEGGRGSGGTWYPADPDGPPLPWWIAPIGAVLVRGEILEAAGRTIAETLQNKGDLGEIVRAFDGDPGGNASIRRTIQEIGAAVVASAAYGHIGGAVGYIDPDCAGTSYETIPPTITPVVHEGFEIHRVSELPRLRAQLEVAVQTLDRVAEDLAPRDDEVKVVATHLKEALEGLGGR